MIRKSFIKGFFSSLLLSIVVFMAIFPLSSKTFAENKKLSLNLENTLYMDLQDGRVVIKMFPEIAPKHVERIKELTRAGFYNGLTFHRVIEDFMAQGGDPDGNGTGGSGKIIPAEFTNKYSHKRGAVSMARSANINSADSQFFIVLKDSAFLDNQYTIWGYVVKGMKYVDNIKKGNPKKNGTVQNPSVIIKMSVAIDIEKRKKNNNTNN